MTNSIPPRLAALLLTLALWPIKSPAKEYVLMVGNEQLRFVAQPQAGYVVKTQQKAGGIIAPSGTLSFLATEPANPIRGLNRHGVWVVERARSVGESEKTIKMLRADRQIQYVAPLFSSNGETVAIIPEIVVRVKPGTQIKQVQALCKTAGCAINKPMEFTEQEYLLEVLGPDAEAVFAAVGKLGQAPQVEWACPNTAFPPRLGDQVVPDGAVADQRLRVASAGQDANTPGVLPNDEYFPMQWHLNNTGQTGGIPGADIRTPEAWEITTGDPNIVVAVFDCGVDTSHPDLINNLVAGYDFIENDPYPDPAPVLAAINAHGTMCAGLIAAQGNNFIGVTGVTWNCKVMPIRAGSVRADGSYFFTTSVDTATAFRWAATHRADIFSNSWFGDPSPQPIMHSAIVDVTKAGGIGRNGRGCVLVSAAANTNSSVWYPARYPEVIAVGATDHKDLRWGYSNYGPDLDITAPGGPFPPGSGGVGPWTTDIVGDPGGHIYNPVPGITDYAIFGGTSAAAPIVAGVAALILSVEPNLTSDEVRHFLERSAKDLGDPGRDDYYGWGRVDARAALDMVLAKRADLNDDWKVDLEDLIILVGFWGTDEPSADIAPAIRRDGIVDELDLQLMMEHWQERIPEVGLLAHWRLDETEGSVAEDRAGDNDGILHGEPQWQPAEGKKAGALQLDGIDDYVSTDFVLNPAEGPFSVFAWVQGGALGQVILSQAGGANWLMAGATNGGLTTELKQSGRQGKPLTSSAIITDGAWHRVGLVWDGLNRILYVDDMEVARDTQPALDACAGGLYIGVGKDYAPTTFFSGLIDDVRIYNRAVTP